MSSKRVGEFEEVVLSWTETGAEVRARFLEMCSAVRSPKATLVMSG